MKAKKISKISKRKIKIHDDCTYYLPNKNSSSKQKICNFWIQKLKLHESEHPDPIMQASFFCVRLKTKNEGVIEFSLPTEYLYAPSLWITPYIVKHKLKLYVSKTKFDTIMIRLINKLIKRSNPILHAVGWYHGYEYRFGKLEKPTDYISKNYDYDLPYAPSNHIKEFWECADLTDHKISFPLLSYMLLAILTYFNLPGENKKPSFILSVTGSTKRSREQIALFYSSLYRRACFPRSVDCENVYITSKDTAADIYSKASYARDHVLIAFEPTRKQRKYIEKLYNNFSFYPTDQKRPYIRGLCLITAQAKEDIEYETFNIDLGTISSNFIKNTFDEDIFCPRKDTLEIPVYYFIERLFEAAEQVSQMEKNADESSNYEKSKKGKKDKKIKLKKFIKKEFENFKTSFWSEFKDDKTSDEISEKAKESALLMSFAICLFDKLTTDNSYKSNTEEAKKIIYDIAKKSFPEPLSEEARSFEDAKRFLNKLDEKLYEDRQNLGIIGKRLSSANAWADENKIYIRESKAKMLCSDDISLTLDIKKSLAQKSLIHTLKKADGKLEYSIPINKQLNEKLSTERYLTFDIKNCKGEELLTKTIGYYEKKFSPSRSRDKSKNITIIN